MTEKSNKGNEGAALLPAVRPFDEAMVVDSDCEPVGIKRILQPKTLTYASYKMSGLQSRILVHIREELCAYAYNNSKEIKRSAAIAVPLFVRDYPTLEGKTRRLYETVALMMRGQSNFVDFRWRYTPEVSGEIKDWLSLCGYKGVVENDRDDEISVSAVLITGIFRCGSNDKVLVMINPLLLPFLLFYGKGVGGTEFDRDISLCLESGYSFRVYEFLMDWSTTRNTHRMSLDEFRDILRIPANYKTFDIQRRVLDVAKRELQAANSDVTFDYTLLYDPAYGIADNRPGQKRANCVEFVIHRKEYVDWNRNNIAIVEALIRSVADSSRQSLCRGYAERIVAAGKAGKIKSKFNYYDRARRGGRMTDDEFRNTMLKVVRDSTGIDLRSDLHIRNAAKSMRRLASGFETEAHSVGDLFAGMA